MMTGLGVLWFILIAVLMIGYFALDGFDLGCGVLYPFIAKSDGERMDILKAIGPVWDGNEVWLLTAGGALFAAFPAAYATSFSGFYLAIMLVLFGLIIRAVCIEFRAHEASIPKLFDIGFFIGSLLPALLLGVAIGNIIVGLPLDANGDYTGSFFALLNPFALLCGVLGLVHMLMQGSAWIACKMPFESELRARALRLRRIFAIADLVVFVLVTLFFFVGIKPGLPYAPGSTVLAAVFAVVFVAGVVAVLVGIKPDDTFADARGPVFAGVSCAGLVGIIAATLFPNLVPATSPLMSVTIANAASSDTTLTVMTLIACIGVPLVLIYHIAVYYSLRGRLK